LKIANYVENHTSNIHAGLSRRFDDKHMMKLY